MKKFLLLLFVFLSFRGLALAQVDNYCLRFSDASGVVNCGRITSLKQNMPYTIQMWLCPAEWKGGAALLRCGTFSIRLGNDRSLLFNDGTAFFYAASDKLTAGRWTHLTMRCGKEETRVWLDNSLVATFPSPLSLPCETHSIWLGGDYNGRLDEVRLWRGELSEDYESFWRNTLNSFNPSWGYLLAYWKMDQERCPNLVDYRGSRHGVLSAQGVRKERVTDNASFRYLKSLAYSSTDRYFDRAIDHQHYQLANCVSFVGARLNSNTAHVYFDLPLNNATLKGGAERLDSHLNRTGVLSLSSPEACLALPAGLLDGQANYAFETWLCLDAWTAGAYIYRAESADGQQGVSLRLGDDEADGSLILRCNGQEYRYRGVMKTGKWTHVGFTTRSGDVSPAQLMALYINGNYKTPKAEDAPTQKFSTQMPALNRPSALGEGLLGKLDDTMLFTASRSSFGDDSRELPFPSENRIMSNADRAAMLACYTYDLEDRPELDFFSVPGFVMKMRENVAGMRGAHFTLTVAANNFESCLADDNKRVQIADDIAALANDPAFDGVDLDFEWTYTPWGWRYYARLCENLYYRLNQGKTISVSPHKVAHAFPTDLMWTVNYFNFQIYDSPELATTSGFEFAHLLFENAGFPKDKILLSYATTSTEGYVNDKVDKEKYPTQAYRHLYPGEEDYDPSLNYLLGPDGEKYWLPSYNEVLYRARYVRDHDLAGIMYWDMGGDLPATEKHSYARAVSYYINSNVEAPVTSVKTSTPAPEDDPYAPIDVPSPDDQQKTPVADLSELRNDMAYNLVNAHGLGLVFGKEDTDLLWLAQSSHENFKAWENPDGPAAAWLLLQHDGQYYLYNMARKKFVEVSRFDVTSQPCRLTDDPMPIEVKRIGKAPGSENTGLFTFRTYTDDDRAYLCASPQLSQSPVCQWTRTDDGAQWMLYTCPYTSTLPYLDEALRRIDPTTGISHPYDTSPYGPYGSSSSSATSSAPVFYDLQGRPIRSAAPSSTSPASRPGLLITPGRKLLIK